MMKTVEVPISNLREGLQLSVKKNKLGRPTYLIPDEEAFSISAADIEVSHGFLIDTATIAYELQCVVSSVEEIQRCK